MLRAQTSRLRRIELRLGTLREAEAVLESALAHLDMSARSSSTMPGRYGDFLDRCRSRLCRDRACLQAEVRRHSECVLLEAQRKGLLARLEVTLRHERRRQDEATALAGVVDQLIAASAARLPKAS
jgi:hypothetical protein